MVINTGAKNNVLPIPGLTTSKNVYDSTELQKLEKAPKTLGIIGGGNIRTRVRKLIFSSWSKSYSNRSFS